MKSLLATLSVLTVLASVATAQTTLSFRDIVVTSNKNSSTSDLANLTLTIDTSTLTGATTTEVANITSWKLEMTGHYTSDLWISVNNTLSSSIFAQGSNKVEVEAGSDRLSFLLEYQYSGDPSGTYSDGVGDPQVGIEISKFSSSAGSLTTNDSAMGDFLSFSAAELGNIQFKVIYNYDTFSGNLGAASISAVPEPSTYAALFGLAAIGFAAFRRNRKTAAK